MSGFSSRFPGLLFCQGLCSASLSATLYRVPCPTKEPGECAGKLIHSFFWPVMAALGHLMDSLFSEALVVMVMQSAVGPVPRGLGCLMNPLIPCPQGPTLSVNLWGKLFRSSLSRVTMCGRAPTRHQRTVQTCCANFRINAGIALHSPNGPALPAFTREQQLAPSKGAAWCPLH